MAGSIYQWSKTPTDNQTADADIDWREGQLPDTVNDSARQMMARIAEFRDDVSGALTAGGTANALTITANSGFTSLAQGRILSLKAAADNTGAVTINVNALGSKAIRKQGPTGDVTLVAGDLKANGVYTLIYSTAANGGAGAWILTNPVVDTSNLARTNAQNSFTETQLFADIVANGTLVGALNGPYPTTGNAAVMRGTTGNPLGGIGHLFLQADPDNAANIVFITGGINAPSEAGRFTSVGDFTVSGSASAGGNISASGALFSSQFFRSTTTTWMAATSSNGDIVFRPGGPGSTTGQVILNTSGISLPGNITASGEVISGSATASGVITANNGFISNQFYRSSTANWIAATGSAGSVLFRPNGSGSTSGQMSLASSGNLTVAGNITANSDRKLKKNIKTVSGALDIVKRLRGVWYTRRKTNIKSVGFVAQEVEAVIPELVHDNETGKSVAYANLVAVLVEAVKELSSRIDKMELRK